MKIDRETIINSLIESDYHYVFDGKDTLTALSEDWFWDIMTNGFIGYANMTDDELIAEYNERNEDGI
jgi:hypothetical protein